MLIGKFRKIFHKSNFSPLVTILIPVYNGEKYVKQAIDSALGQAYDNIEIIIVNDGSNDNTEKIVKSYGSKLRYFKKKNGGVSTALNLGIKMAKGDYISWLSHDDMYYPEKIKKQIEALNKIPKEDRYSTILFSNIHIIDSKGKVIDKRSIHRYHNIKKLKYPLYPIIKGLINGCTLLVPKKCYLETGLFVINLKTTSDYDLWYRMLPKYKLLYQKYYLVMSRQHSGQGTYTSKAIEETDELWIKLVSNLSDEQKIKIDGSIKAFNKNMYKLMQKERHEKSAEFMKKQLLKNFK